MSAKSHLQRIHNCACVVCTKMGIEQTSKTIAHHLEVVRDENTNYAAISLCDTHHTMLHAMSGRSFEMHTKLTPIDLLALTIKQMDTEGMLA